MLSTLDRLAGAALWHAMRWGYLALLVWMMFEDMRHWPGCLYLIALWWTGIDNLFNLRR